nr:hypothetical protein GCM10010200_094000 [Actinomadura rugatobispora]
MVGIVSEMDLLRGAFEADPRAFARPPAAPGAPPPRRVEEIMTTEVRTARPASDAAALAEMMITTGIKSVPVLDGPVLAGIVSRRDLLAVLARDDARVRDDVIAVLDEQGAGGRWAVTVHDGSVELRGEADEAARAVADVLARTVPGVSRVTVLEPTPDQGEGRKDAPHSRRRARIWPTGVGHDRR